MEVITHFPKYIAIHKRFVGAVCFPMTDNNAADYININNICVEFQTLRQTHFPKHIAIHKRFVGAVCFSMTDNNAADCININYICIEFQTLETNVPAERSLISGTIP
jgi:hypothetical protein